MISVPKYRAKKIDSDEWVVGDLYSPNKNIYSILEKRSGMLGNYDELIIEPNEFFDIDPSTLAIHFPNMIDKNGKKIFASLSEYGVGGDIMLHERVKELISDELSNGHKIIFDGDYKYLKSKSPLNKVSNKVLSIEYEVIGIHKGESCN